jgi:hypothetical protein
MRRSDATYKAFAVNAVLRIHGRRQREAIKQFQSALLIEVPLRLARMGRQRELRAHRTAFS